MWNTKRLQIIFQGKTMGFSTHGTTSESLRSSTSRSRPSPHLKDGHMEKSKKEILWYPEKNDFDISSSLHIDR